MILACPQCGSANRVPEERLGDQPVCGRCKADLLPAEPIELSDASFGPYIGRSEIPVLVDFWAAWCGPCRMMAPHFAAAAKQWPPQQLRFAKVDTEANPAVSTEYAIRSIPTLILFRGGREIARHSGALIAGDLLRWVQRQLQARA